MTVRQSRVFGIAFALTLGAMVCLPLPAARGADGSLGIDLQGESQPLFLIEETDSEIDNPHDLPCDSCHLPGSGGARQGPLKCGDDTISLCRECHPDNLHPVGVPAAGVTESVPGALPLGEGAEKGKIVCLTCHYIHQEKTYERHLLRQTDKKAARRIDALCAACHGTRLKEKSPHLGAGKACHLCHMNQPRSGEGLRNLGTNVQAICNFCHNALDNRHYLALDPFTDEYILEQTAAVTVPMLNGRFTCISCHDPHAAAGRKKLLREEYLGLAGISKKINPHWKNVMCISCHEGEPEKGRARLKEGGDVIRLCFRCHAFKYSRSDIHPVNVMPSRLIAIPADMPLRNGRITCETCHDSSLQEGGEQANSVRKTNPKFLRGGFVSRNEFCSRCHARRLIGLLNPHDHVDSRGKKDRIKCLFCHSSLPEGMPGWMVRRQFDDETVNQLCLLCHPDRYQESHPMAPHFLSPSRAVSAALETSEERIGITFSLFNDRVVCITCHNPHQDGVIENPKPAGEAAPLRRLRVGADICVGCHPSKFR